MQMLQASPPEEFLNLLLQGAITKTHTNWLTAEKKKFTQVDFNQLLSKCESGRVMSEIARIIELDNLSSRTSHFITEAPLHHTTVSCPSLPAVEYISSSSSVDYQENQARESARNSSVDYRNNQAPGSARDSEYGYSDAKICSANIQKLPDNHKALLATFTPSEQLKVIELLKLHSDYLSYDLLIAMDTNDFDKILRALLSSLSTYSKYLFLPYYLHQKSQFRIKSSDDCKVTLITRNFIDVPSSSHIYLDLDLQILCRSTFLQLSPIMKDGALFIQKLSSTSVTAKHELVRACCVRQRSKLRWPLF
jgi:hypothetical protein